MFLKVGFTQVIVAVSNQDYKILILKSGPRKKILRVMILVKVQIQDTLQDTSHCWLKLFPLFLIHGDPDCHLDFALCFEPSKETIFIDFFLTALSSDSNKS